MKLKKNVIKSLVLSFVVFFAFTGCKWGCASPDIVNVNVVNENFEELNNCTFSATLDGKELSDLHYNLVDFSSYSWEQNYTVYDSETERLSENVRKVNSAYNLYSFKISEIITEMETITYDKMEDLYSRIIVTLDCDGYESLVFSPVLKESSHVAENIIVQLKKK